MADPKQFTSGALSQGSGTNPAASVGASPGTSQGMARGHDISFFSLDLTNTCWTRSFYSGAGTVLVLCQANDLELDDYEPVLRAICASLEVEEE